MPLAGWSLWVPTGISERSPGEMAIDNVFGEAPGQGDRGQYKNSEQTFLNISISAHYEEK